MSRPKDLIKTAEARLVLGISTVKMADLIKRGVVKTYPNILDRRIKLVSRKELDKLMPFRREAA